MSDKWYPGFPLEVSKDLENDPMYKRKLELIEDCKEHVRSTTSRKRPLNIAVVGPPGCGKSSFLNTVFASFNEKQWIEHAKYGNFEGSGKQVTRRLKAYDRKKYFSGDDDVLMPTFLDMTGFENDNTNLHNALLDIVFSGKLRDNELLSDIVQFGIRHGERALRDRFIWRPSYYKVDRIIIVCSSNPDSNLPNVLLEAIVDTAISKDLTVYGVLTHADEFQVDFDDRIAERERKFRTMLGIPETRFARIVNYCPAIDPTLTFEDTVIPSLDVPVLRLMKQILTPEPKDTDLQSIEDYINLIDWSVLKYAVGFFLIPLFWFLLPQEIRVFSAVSILAIVYVLYQRRHGNPLDFHYNAPNYHIDTTNMRNYQRETEYNPSFM